MKRLLRNRFGGTIDETIGAICGIGLTLLTFWGIGWSFYRHGMVHGAIAVFVPPYAWYRGVAAIWDKPEWKEHYDVRTEQLAVVITNSLNNDPNYQFQS